jgi:hypothetical protein
MLGIRSLMVLSLAAFASAQQTLEGVDGCGVSRGLLSCSASCTGLLSRFAVRAVVGDPKADNLIASMLHSSPEQCGRVCVWSNGHELPVRRSGLALRYPGLRGCRLPAWLYASRHQRSRRVVCE